MKKNFLSRFAVIAVGMFILFSAGLFIQPSRANAAQPNIILINVDNMGWGDLCKNNPGSPACQKYTNICDTSDPGATCIDDRDCMKTPTLEGCKSLQSNTPRLDSLASAGVTLTNFYTPTPICSPSRAALMTGKDPRRPQIYSALLGVKGEKFLDKNFTTIAKVLGKSNYNTAIVGKWHLGWDDKANCAADNSCNCPIGGCNSWDHGFQYNYVLPLGIGQTHNGFCLVEKIPGSEEQKWHYINNIFTYNDEFTYSNEKVTRTYIYGFEQYTNVGGDDGRCGKKAKEAPEAFSNFSAGTSLTQILTKKAVDYIKSVKADALNTTSPKPFFLYLAYPAPHSPLYIHLNQIESTSYKDINTATYLKPNEVLGSCADTCIAPCKTPCDENFKCAPEDADCLNKREACMKNCLNNALPCIRQSEMAGIYSDVIKEIDVNVELLLKEICGGDADADKKCDSPLYDNTIVIFISDNGPFLGDHAEYVNPGSTGGMRGGQKFTYEGGVRVPFIARWPAGGWDGGSNHTLGQFADMKDIFPTIVKMALKDSGLCLVLDDCVNNGKYANDTARIKFTGKDKVLYDIAIDGKDISNVLDAGAANTDQKNIQISWFGNFPICVQSNNGICNVYQDSHPFAIRSNVTFNVPSDIANYKLYLKRDALFNVSKPEELYNLSTNLSESESFNDSNMCYVGSLNICSCYAGSANLCCVGSVNYCSQCSINNTTNVAACPAELGTYKSIVELLWKRANLYQGNVKDNKCQGDLFTDSKCP